MSLEEASGLIMFMETEVYELLVGAQSILEDRWLGEAEPPETVHRSAEY